jgi:phosphatidylserine/phosphatidylglycerophosphate/cardiolipin synthase-like enzyme
MVRSLIALPDDSAQPIVDAVANAKHSLRIKMFVLSDPLLLNTVIAAKKRGVKVHAILNEARRDGEKDNERARKALEHAGVEVRNGSPAFALTHEKSMVVDESSAFVMSLNWATKNLTQTRDYAVVTTKRHDVDEIIEGFDADWHRRRFAPAPDSHLVWCPGPARDLICQLIDDARHRVVVQNERFQDSVIIERFVRAARRGVKVEVMARAPHTLKREKLVEGVGGLRIMDDVGIKVRKLKHLKLHGKALLADDSAAIVGSINLAEGSLDHRRELGIAVRGDEVVDRLRKVLRHDWEHSRPLDLSDEGLLADLEDRVKEGGHLLSLDGHDDRDN